MPDSLNTAAAIAIGQKNAGEVLARRKIAQASRAKALANLAAKRLGATEIAKGGLPEQALQEVPNLEAVSSITAGYLVAAGDSWFDYPIHDVVTKLEDNYGYSVESAAHKGDPIEAMPSPVGQLDKVSRCFDKIAGWGAAPIAVLLSGGGDDIAGKEFGMLLNNAKSPIAGWNSQIVDGLLNQRIITAYKSMSAAIESLSQAHFKKSLPVFMHGYDYPVPDGRGFLGGWPFPGPWLKPGFDEKLFEDLQANVKLMHDIIDRFNAMLQQLVGDAAFANVHYVDLRGTLSADLNHDAYQTWWANELHPTEAGFSAVAARFAAELEKL